MTASSGTSPSGGRQKRTWFAGQLRHGTDDALIQSGDLQGCLVKEANEFSVRYRRPGRGVQVLPLNGERRRVDTQALVERKGFGFCLPAGPAQLGVELHCGPREHLLHKVAVTNS